jgi:hypothetical protein
MRRRISAPHLGQRIATGSFFLARREERFMLRNPAKAAMAQTARKIKRNNCFSSS